MGNKKPKSVQQSGDRTVESKPDAELRSTGGIEEVPPTTVRGQTEHPERGEWLEAKRERDSRSDRRDQILTAALHLFASRGIDGTGMREIASQVGITQPTLYHYFESKEALLTGLIDRHAATARAMQDRVATAIEVAPSLRAGMLLLVDNFSRQWAEPTMAAFQRILFSELARGGKLAERLMRDFLQPRLDRASALFKGLQQAGRIRDLDPDLLAMQFMGPIIFTTMIRSVQSPALTPEQMREFLFQHVETFIRGVERS